MKVGNLAKICAAPLYAGLDMHLPRLICLHFNFPIFEK